MLEEMALLGTLGDIKYEAEVSSRLQLQILNRHLEEFPNKRHRPCCYQSGGKQIDSAREKSGLREKTSNDAQIPFLNIYFG